MSLENSTALVAGPRAALRPGRGLQISLLTLIGGVLLAPRSLWACAACYGQSDSAMAAGMNWGILSLLGIIVFVLGGVAGFFVFLARRSMKLSVADAEKLLAGEINDGPAASQSGSEALELGTLAARGRFAGTAALSRRRPTCAHPGPRVRN